MDFVYYAGFASYATSSENNCTIKRTDRRSFVVVARDDRRLRRFSIDVIKPIDYDDVAINRRFS